MSRLGDAIKAGGYVPKANEDGIFKPYSGDYYCDWTTLRKETRKDGSSYWLAEWNITEVLDGMQKRESKYADFRKFYSFDLESDGTDERQVKALQDLKDDAFTVGVELDDSSDEALAASAGALIGKQTYIHAFEAKSWKKEGDAWVENEEKGKKQGVSIRQGKLALKKWPNGGVKF